MRAGFLLVGALAMVAAAPPEVSEEAHAVCSGVDNSRLPAMLAPMSNAAAAIVAGRVAVEGGALGVGQARSVGLLPASEVRFAGHVATNPVAGETYAGAVTLNIVRAGNYAIALGDAVWIDLIGRNLFGAALQSIGHVPGPQCSAVRKIVRFKLEPGDYAVQLSAAPAARVTILIVPETGA